MALKLTTAEAKALIEMVKRTIENENLNFPEGQGKLEFEVKGERRTDEFIVNIDRKGPDAQKCTYQGRIKSSNVILMRLDMNPTAVHTNPSGEKINGTHLHIYTEEYEMRNAVPFDVKDKDLFATCFTFFEQFNIIEQPKIIYQPNLL